jgi:hypothetical protein
MTISLTVNMWHKTTKLEALLDCGATHNFINPRTISSLNMGTQLLPQPLTVRNVDGTMTVMEPSLDTVTYGYEEENMKNT